MTWIVRRLSPRSVRPNAHGALALVTLLAMGAAAVMPAGESATEAHALSPNGKAATGAELDGAPAEARNGARPAPLGRERSHPHADHPAAEGPAIEAPGIEAPAIEVPGPVAEHDGQAALRLPGGAAVDTTSESEAPKAKGRKREPRPEPEREAAPPPPPPFPEGSSRLFANRDGVKLYTPSADPVYVGFHEAAYPNALSLLPLGEPVINDNGGKYRAPGPTPTGQRFTVLSSRGRPHHAATAADIVMRPGEPVRSVVTGTVIEVAPYFLYGKYPDARVRIRSAEDPDVIVTMLHVTRVWAQVGQQVTAGETLIAETATSFPFMSQIDYYLGGTPNPHVHVELKRE